MVKIKISLKRVSKMVHFDESDKVILEELMSSVYLA